MLLLIISFFSTTMIFLFFLIVLLPSVRIGKEDNKVTNLIHLFCSHLANICTPEENDVVYCFVLMIAIEIRRTFRTRTWQQLFCSCVISLQGLLCCFEVFESYVLIYILLLELELELKLKLICRKRKVEGSGSSLCQRS